MTDACEHSARACAKCEGDRNRVRVDRVAKLIRDLRECDTPWRERELVIALRDADHPDVDGLVAAIAARRERDGQRGERRRARIDPVERNRSLPWEND